MRLSGFFPPKVTCPPNSDGYPTIDSERYCQNVKGSAPKKAATLYTSQKVENVIQLVNRSVGVIIITL